MPLGATPHEPLEALHAAVRRRVPGVAVKPIHIPQAPDWRQPDDVHHWLRVSYQTREPRLVAWDDQKRGYVWDACAQEGELLAHDPEQAADAIAEVFGAPTRPDQPEWG